MHFFGLISAPSPVLLNDWVEARKGDPARFGSELEENIKCQSQIAICPINSLIFPFLFLSPIGSTSKK